MKTLDKERLTSAKLSDWQLPLSFSRAETTFSRENLFDLLYYTGQEAKGIYTNGQSVKLRTQDRLVKAYNPSHSLMAFETSYYNSAVLSPTNTVSASLPTGSSLRNMPKYAFSISAPTYDSRAKKTYKSLFDKTSENFSTVTYGDLFNIWWKYAGQFVKSNLYPSAEAYLEQVCREASIVYDYPINKNTPIADIIEGSEKFDKDWSLQYHDQDALKLPHIAQGVYSELHNISETDLSETLRTKETTARKIVSALINTVGKDETYYAIADNGSITLSPINANGDDQILYAPELSQHDEDLIVKKVSDFFESSAGSWDKSFNELDYDNPVACRTLIYKLSLLVSDEAEVYNGTKLTLAAKDTDANLMFYGSQLNLDDDLSKRPIAASFVSMHDYDDSPLLNLSEEGKEQAQRYVYYNSLRVSNVLANEIISYLVPAYSTFSLSHLSLLSAQGVNTVYSPHFINAGDGNSASESTIKMLETSIPILEFLKEVIKLTYKTEALSNESVMDEIFTKVLTPWLRNECCVFSGRYLGDFIDERLFKQDLTPDADVNFGSLNVGSYNERNYPGLIDKPYLPQTVPMIDADAESIEGIYNDQESFKKAMEDPEFKFKHISKRMSSLSLSGKVSAFPPTMLDIDSAEYHAPLLERAYGKPRQQMMPFNGTITADEKIISKTTDSIWEYLKLATESTDENALPEFFGFDRNALSMPDHKKNVRLFKHLRSTVDEADYIDILRWEPNYVTTEAQTSSGLAITHTDTNGYEVKKYISRPIDYKVKFFGRRAGVAPGSATNDEERGSYVASLLGYEFEEDIGYLEPMLDAIGLQLGIDHDPSDYDEDQHTAIATNAYKRFYEITNFDDENSRFYPYKEYKEHPKTLRVLEKDLEEVRMNMYAVVAYINAMFVRQGFGNTPRNSGSLYQLHRNYFVYNSSKDNVDSLNTYLSDLLDESSDTKSIESTNLNTDKLLPQLDGFIDASYPYYEVVGEDISSIIYNPNGRVLFDDGAFSERYAHKNYDSFVLDINFEKDKVRKQLKSVRRPANSTSLSEVYLAADGTWRSIHEHPVAPVLDVDF